MEAKKVDSPPNPFLIDTPRHRTKYPAKKVVKYILSLGLIWFILHRWLFPFTHYFTFLRRPSAHAHTCAHDIAWAIDAFAAEEVGIPTSRLAENFFL
jgi:hypothetical protein